ncbi:MAG: NrfD/PsrC family molybdoenzyme membrane anchor subunit [bacterium]
MNRVQTTKLVLWLIAGFAAAVGVTRFIFGLGPTTNLSDATPWGFWIGFDVMAGVALAAGGFVMTAAYYITKRESLHSMVRPAVLTAFLGYLAVIFGLLFDLGLPWSIWHMMIYWNPHSPLFEVGWCVMLYTTVLLLEFSPVPLENTSRYAKVRQFLLKLRFPLVLLGIMLSTLHQSSLGSLFLIMPFRLHPLWYTPALPIMFFVSAIALGMMMVSLESLVSHWLYRRDPGRSLVAKLARAAVWVLGIYLILKLGELMVAGEFALVFDGTWESNLFIVEMLVAVIIPLAMFSVPRWRQLPGVQWAGSLMVVLGMVLNRLNVGGITMLGATGDSYVPSWQEISISLGVVAAVGLVFLFAVEKFRIWDKPPQHPEADAHARPEFDHTSEVWLGSPFVAARTKYSLAFLVAFAIGFALMPGGKIHGDGVIDAPVSKARGGKVLFVDGNHDDYGVAFDHARHIDSLGGDESCDRCHHMNNPMDQQSGCWECHRQMYRVTDAFNHDWHASPAGGNLSCGQCHEGQKQTKTAKRCDACHLDLYPEKATITVDDRWAPSYTDAMHTACIGCHREKAEQSTELQRLTQCTTCHQSQSPAYLTPDALRDWQRPYFNRVILPPAPPTSEETTDRTL